MDELEEIKATFFMECEELLADLENGLSAMESGSADGETINAVFRAVHSVKGGAGAFGLDPLVRFAHVFETLMDDIRSHKVEATAVLVRELLRAADILADHVQAAKTGAVADEARSAEMATILEALSYGGKGAPAAAAPSMPAPTPIAFTPAKVNIGGDDIGSSFKPMTVSLVSFDEPAPPSAAEPWKVSFRPKSELYRNANDPLLLLRELERLGAITVEIDDSALPPLEDLEPESSYLAFTVTLDAPVEESVIRDVFEFVDGDCDVEIVGGAVAPAFDLAALLAAADAVEPVVAAPEIAPPPPAPELSAAPAPVVESAPAPEPAPAPEFTGTLAAAIKTPAQPQPAKAATPEAQATIRVDPERIDRLIDLVGELVINQAMLAQRVIESGLASSSGVALGLDELEQLTRQIQDGHPRPVGEVGVPAHAAPGARSRQHDRQAGPPGDGRRGHRGRQDRDRTARRADHAYAPQRYRPWS
jgi:two-component system chemotaxis sensor kinase CheA